MAKNYRIKKPRCYVLRHRLCGGGPLYLIAPCYPELPHFMPARHDPREAAEYDTAAEARAARDADDTNTRGSWCVFRRGRVSR